MSSETQTLEGLPPSFLEALARGELTLSSPLRGAEKLAGGASPRSFYRLKLEQGEPLLLMVFPAQAGLAGAAQSQGSAAFVEVANLLRERGLEVPRLYGEDRARGLLLVEDLGDDTLAARLQSHPEEASKLYRQAVAALAKAQKQCAEVPPNSQIRQRRFGADFYRFELQHFLDYLPAYLGHQVSEAERARYAEFSEAFIQQILSLPQAFLHRDYQSKNLMVSGERLVWIDFQDAFFGPRVYDLVALLEDSYQSFPPGFAGESLRYFAEQAKLQEQQLALEREYWLVCLQRKLKDAGRFVYLEQVQGKPGFLKYLPRALQSVQNALTQLQATEAWLRPYEGLLRSWLSSTASSTIND